MPPLVSGEKHEFASQSCHIDKKYIIFVVSFLVKKPFPTHIFEIESRDLKEDDWNGFMERFFWKGFMATKFVHNLVILMMIKCFVQ